MSTLHAVHRHTSHEHEHEFEAAPGLPEPLPPGEHILWQGAPEWRTMARECFHVRKLAIYFGLVILLRVVTLPQDGGWTAHLLPVGVFIALSLAALSIALALAWLSSRTALYTITDKRVVMRVGIVLSVTFNLPFKRIDAASLHALPKGRGDLALTLDGSSQIAYLHLWPHARPWQVRHTQPSLRCIPDAAAVAALLTDAWRAARQEAPRTVERAVAIDEAPAARPAPVSRPPVVRGTLAGEPAVMA